MVLLWLGDDDGVDQGDSSGDSDLKGFGKNNEWGLTGKLEVEDEGR